MPVPVFPDKSSKQGTIDLAHTIVNAMAEIWCKLSDWDRQCTIAEVTSFVNDEKKTIDFVLTLSNGKKIALEVQFGNGGRLQADFAKFRTLHEQGLLALGVAVYFDRATAATADSGLAYYEAALKEMAKFGDMPVAIVGLSRDESPLVDLRDLPDIVFPSILGGSGKGRLDLHAEVALAILEGRPLAQLVLKPENQQVIYDHALEHVDKGLAALAADFERVNACRNPELRMRMLAKFVDFVRNTYMPIEERIRTVKAAAELTVDEEAAKIRARKAATRERRLAQAKRLRAEKRAAERQQRLAAKATEKALAKAAAKPAPRRKASLDPVVEVDGIAGEGSAAELTPDCKAPETVAAGAVIKLVRVKKADEDARLAREAEARARPQPCEPARVPTWNAMGAAMAAALARTGT